MKINDEIIVKIEKLTNLGAGIAKIDGMVIFINNTCPQDIVKIKITKINKNYAYADIIAIVTPSPYRVQAFCPMEKVCGSCQMQFIDYRYQLSIKKQIVEETIKNISGMDIPIFETIPSPNTKNYRYKIQYPISQTKNSKRLLAGYYKPKTHEIINIKYCPIQPEICDKIIAYIRDNAGKFGIEGYNEIHHSGLLRHVIIRSSVYSNKNLVTLVINSKNNTNKIKEFAKAIYNEFDEVSGVCTNYNYKKTNIILGKNTQCLYGCEYIEEKILDKIFRISADTFFQVNPKSAENIFAYVKNYIKEKYTAPLVLDAYAGISAFGICVSDVCQKVISVEENTNSCNLAKIVAQENQVNNIEINNMDAGKFFKKENRQFDVVILDPPRKGCTKQSLDDAYRLSKDTIIYVSCNPATLARDLKYLAQKGCKVISIQPFDMFCHTYHIENVAIINKD